jgi:catalase (peroxidase I)
MGLVDGVTPCGFAPEGNGRNAAAEWIRTAFHDFATHDTVKGTGGLDASIAFETDRAENPGAAFNSTLGFLLNGYSSRVSMADMIAFGVYASVRMCGGPNVPVRAGRIDAMGPGVLGVPEPQHDIKTIKARFQGAGFKCVVQHV